jgi:6-phosphogluconolactonase (cycloisomerase 2 family)
VGTLYAMTNQTVNQIVVFARAADGSLHQVQRVNTGGAGSPSGNPPFPQDHLDADHEIKLTATASGTLLFAVNAGDNTVSSFRVGPQGLLTLVDREPSGGVHPVSLDTYNGLLYVVNELDRHGHDISGLRYTPQGMMTPIPGSTRSLATPFTLGTPSGFYGEPLPSQVIFSPDGRELVVTERTSNDFQGQLDTFAIAADGTPGPVQVNATNAPIPFGMAWDNNGHLIVANAGPPPPPFAMSSASSYSWSGTTLTPIDNQSSNASATCWVSITNDGTYAFMSSQLSNDVSRFAIAKRGRLTLLSGNVPTSGHAADTALSTDSRYLYVLDVLNANGHGGALIDSYSVGPGGSLVHLATTDPRIPDSASGLASN